MRTFRIARYWCALQWADFLYWYASGRERDAKEAFFTCPAPDYRETWYFWQSTRRRVFFDRSKARANYLAARGDSRVLA